MKTLTIGIFLQLSLYLIGFFMFFFLVNAFFGRVYEKHGVVQRKFIKPDQTDKIFCRVSLQEDTAMVDVQCQPRDYNMIDVGDSVKYYIRVGLFNQNIIERYNAKVK